MGIVLALLSAACSSGDGGSETAETGTSTVETVTPTVAATGPTGGDVNESVPIVSVITAHDVDDAGVAVDPALECARDVTQISVVVRVGEVEPDATLDVAWAWLDGPDGEQALFEHQIDVGSGDVAYSHGVAAGPLAAGRYRAAVTLGRRRPTRCSRCVPRRSCFPRRWRGRPPRIHRGAGPAGEGSERQDPHPTRRAREPARTGDTRRHRARLRRTRNNSPSVIPDRRPVDRLHRRDRRELDHHVRETLPMHDRVGVQSRAVRARRRETSTGMPKACPGPRSACPPVNHSSRASASPGR